MENIKLHPKITPESKNLCREDFDGGPVSLDEIEPGLFLGNLTAACSKETMKNYQITHILTLDSVPLPAHITEQSFLTTKYVHISDMPKEDILHHLDNCIDFINSALEKGKVLVHCYFGVSRSSTVVIAYVMKKYSIEYGPAFEKVRSMRKYVQPNIGFIFQLKLYRRMGCKIDRQYQKYKTYRLRIAADKVKKAKILPQNCMDLIKPDPGITQENPDPIVYRCRKCRRVLANKSCILVHMPKIADNEDVGNGTNDEQNLSNGEVEQISDKLKNTSVGGELNDDGSCKSILFLEPIAWMKDILNHSQGRLNCPKCSQKLGSFSWVNGCHCPCGAEISPAFYLVPSKVELSKVIQNVQMTV